jgi:holliday junction DNA helicase RuvB
MQEIDAVGLDKQDRRYLETLIQVFRGGPTGAEALAATMNIAVDTITDEVEPYLLRKHFIVRTPRGRRATAQAYQHLGLREPESDVTFFNQPRLFE